MSGYAKDSAGKNPRGFSSKASLWEDFILQYSTHLSGHRYHRWDVTGHDGACHGMPMLICRTSLCHEEKCELHMLHGVSRSSIERNMILIYKKDGNGQMNTNETWHEVTYNRMHLLRSIAIFWYWMPRWQMSNGEIQGILALFDVDGTLTEARKVVSPETVSFLQVRRARLARLSKKSTRFIVSIISTAQQGFDCRFALFLMSVSPCYWMDPVMPM